MRAEPGAPRRLAIALLLLFSASSALAGCIHETTVGPRLGFPFWNVTDPRVRPVGCARLAAWVSKTGKEGLGVSVQIAAPEVECPVTLARAKVEIGRESVPVSGLPPPRTLPKGEVVQAYLPFLFDNEAAWNANRVDGTLVLEMQAGQAQETVVLPMHEAPFSFRGEEPLPSPPPGTYRVTPIQPGAK